MPLAPLPLVPRSAIGHVRRVPHQRRNGLDSHLQLKSNGVSDAENVLLNSSEDISRSISCSMVSPCSDSTSKDPKSIMPKDTFCEMLCSSSSQFPSPFPFGAKFPKSSVKVSLCSAIGFDVANAPTAKTFFVGSAFPSTFSVAFARIVPRLFSDFQTVQFSVFTFYELVNCWHRDCRPLRSIFPTSLERDHGCGC